MGREDRASLIATVADWMAGRDLGTYAYAADIHKMKREGLLEHVTMDFLIESGSAVVAIPSAA